ncbi:flagella basal body P-ring formation protein FlgA [Sphingosinicella sp.]|uniref:flagella basal body P-ring formation protein FlgA n=1 Tax=Sphingosinicella sp. TaxID=1917971 RepID=UPI004037B10B
MATLRPADALALHDRRVRLGDVAQVSGTERASEFESRVIAMLPAARRSVTLQRAALADLIRRAVPGLAVRGGPDALVIRRDRQLLQSADAGCFVLTSPVASGAMLRSSDLTATPCTGRGDDGALVRVDRAAGALRAAQSLPGGAYLGRLTLPSPPDVERGQALTVVSAVGPVRIERQVIALQNGRDGRRAFVRDAEGQIFAAPLSVTSEERQ